jgi:hypothetical protein
MVFHWRLSFQRCGKRLQPREFTVKAEIIAVRQDKFELRRRIPTQAGERIVKSELLSPTQARAMEELIVLEYRYLGRSVDSNPQGILAAEPKY